MINASQLVINDLTFINANITEGSALLMVNSNVTTNNVVFKNSVANNGVISASGTKYLSNNDVFKDVTSTKNGVIKLYRSAGTFDNATFTSSKDLVWGFIYDNGNSALIVRNSVFANTTSKYCAAIKGPSKVKITNTTFTNLNAFLSAGAIAAKEMDYFEVDGCTFVNVTSTKNGGAIFIDKVKESYILNSSFTNCTSGFGGAILALSSSVDIENSTFVENGAVFDGGAVYVSWCNLTIFNSTFTKTVPLENNDCYGAVLYCDHSSAVVNNTKIIDNIGYDTGVLYFYDSEFAVVNSTFKDNINFDGKFDDIFSVFDLNDAVLINNTFSGEGSVSLKNTDYNIIVDLPGAKITLINNSIVVDTLPAKFDSRDWGWITPVKDQAQAGFCWSFGSAGAMEAAILKNLGIVFDISENNIQGICLQYSRYGLIGHTEGGKHDMALNYALSWLGVLSSEHDTYDELGKVTPVIWTEDNVHFQDVVIIPGRKNVTDNNPLKEAIMKYGAVAITYFAADEPFVNYTSGAQYYNGLYATNHGVTLVGWDDTYSASNFDVRPPGDGAWIIKNSWGTNAGVDGYFYISYYDTCFAMKNSYAYMISNTEQYNKNYQYDLQGNLGYLNIFNQYKNVYIAEDDDLIGAVGTYFNQSNVTYTIKVYVNDSLKYVQTGASVFGGFNTIKLDTYVPIKKGDKFAVEIKSNSAPFLVGSRQHYLNNWSYFYYGGEEAGWYSSMDAVPGTPLIFPIKVFTVVDDSKLVDNTDMTVDYAFGKYFTVKVVTADGKKVGAGEKVTFLINGKKTVVTTDINGVAKVKITGAPNKYTILTYYKGKSVKNTITIKHVVSTSKVSVKKTAKSFTLKATVKINGKYQKGNVFKFKGKTYKATTDSKCVAKVVIKKSVINKLKKGKTYTFSASFVKDTVKSTVKVR